MGALLSYQNEYLVVNAKCRLISGRPPVKVKCISLRNANLDLLLAKDENRVPDLVIIN